MRKHSRSRFGALRSSQEGGKYERLLRFPPLRSSRGEPRNGTVRLTSTDQERERTTTRSANDSPAARVRPGAAPEPTLDRAVVRGDTPGEQRVRPRLHPQPILIGARRRDDGAILETYPEPIRDAGAFCQRLVDDSLRNWGMHITNEEYEDVVADMLALLCQLERNFDPRRTPSFAGYARFILGRRAVDLVPRKLLGRNGQRIADRSHEELDDRALDVAGSHEAVTTQPGDHADDRHADDGRLQGDRDRRAAWAHSVLGLRAA